MEYGIIHLSAVPVRSDSNHRSEMISQLLFGETIKVRDKYKGWCKVQCTFDGYEGWIDAKQFLPLPGDAFQKHNGFNSAFALDICQPAIANDYYIPILLGSSLPDYDGVNFKLGKHRMVYNGQAITSDNTPASASLVARFALKYLHAPYLWGGRSPFGIDCSGLVQMSYKLVGIPLQRDAYQQIDSGKIISFIEEANEGDTAFFEDETGKITHTGIFINAPLNAKDGKYMIHAHGKVRIDRIDHYGIYNSDTKKYSHKLRAIKRIL